MKKISILIFSLFLVGCTNITPDVNIGNDQVTPSLPPPIPVLDQKAEAFCGSSTEGFCHQDADCQTFGCSGQICGSRFEEGLASTCVWRECYDETDYSLVCGCLNQKCQWYK